MLQRAQVLRSVRSQEPHFCLSGMHDNVKLYGTISPKIDVSVTIGRLNISDKVILRAHFSFFFFFLNYFFVKQMPSLVVVFSSCKEDFLKNNFYILWGVFY